MGRHRPSLSETVWPEPTEESPFPWWVRSFLTIFVVFFAALGFWAIALYFIKGW